MNPQITQLYNDVERNAISSQGGVSVESLVVSLQGLYVHRILRKGRSRELKLWNGRHS